MNWLLPEYIADALPREAERIENLRRRLLDLFRTHGYEFVMPPLLEYLDSLLTGAGQDLRLRTFKLVDQLSGRTMGIRADMTPQVTRIDAHLLNREGVTRLCYCDSVLHTLPASPNATREPIQLGAELYGFAGIDADVEVVRLMARTLATSGLTTFRIDLGHVGIFKALARHAGLPMEAEEELFAVLQAKDVPSLQALCAGLAEPYRSALLRLPTLYGGPDVLEQARRELPALPEVTTALDGLTRLQAALPDLQVSVDLADVRGYHYHNGVVFAAYAQGFAGAVALGGRYDGVGEAFGRSRPATGFSLDLRELARLAPAPAAKGGIQAPASADAALVARVDALRAAGEIVVVLMPGEAGTGGTYCDRRLVQRDGAWIIENIS